MIAAENVSAAHREIGIHAFELQQRGLAVGGLIRPVAQGVENSRRAGRKRVFISGDDYVRSGQGLLAEQDPSGVVRQWYLEHNSVRSRHCANQQCGANELA